MPEVRNCRSCGKIFSYMGGIPLCPACRQKDEEDFKRVKEYLYDNPGATLSEVSKVLEISVEKIKRFLRDGRLEIVDESGNMVLECENCGRAIRTGRYCEFCQRELASGLQTMAVDIKNSLSRSSDSRGAKLRYLSMEDDKNKE